MTGPRKLSQAQRECLNGADSARIVAGRTSDGVTVDAGNVLSHILAIEAERDAALAQVGIASRYADFGSHMFEAFWKDGEPGDVDAEDAAEWATDAGLLARRAEKDAGAVCAEGCDWQEGQPLDECSCLFPTTAPFWPEAVASAALTAEMDRKSATVSANPEVKP